ncbi:MAG TPA: hypothetical protein VLX91_15195 [Candidatus Acidoferrales bacterium]|nr:hypothetical protein [Candidatus Acidoferrales bacterium]
MGAVAIRRLVCRLFSQIALNEQRTKRFLNSIGVVAVFSSVAFARQDTSSMKSMPAEFAVDSLSARFEDIYGRLPYAALSSLSYSYYEESVDISSRYDGLVDHFNTGEANFMVGNRTSYEVAGDLRNSWPNDRDRFYNIGIALRPGSSWEFAGHAEYEPYRVEYEEYEGESTTKHTSLGLSATYLSGGRMNFSEERLKQYYYFSDLLLDPDQFAFSFSPTYLSESLTGQSIGDGYSIGLPVRLTYGLSDRFAIGMNGYFDFSSGKSSLIFSNGIFSYQGNSWEVKPGFNLSYMVNDGDLLKFGIDWYYHEQNENLFDSTNDEYQGLYREERKINDRYNFAILSASWNIISTKRFLSTYDLRRLLYTGAYLCRGETINQARIDYLTDEYYSLFSESSVGSTKKILLSDSLVIGTLDFLQLELAGSLGAPLREGSFWTDQLIGGLTFHNLRFNGTELNDFDYFFGMIDNAGDYSATVNIVLSNVESDRSPRVPDLQVDFIGRFGIITELDAGFNLTYETWKYSGGSSPYENWAWGGSIRGNILDRLRLQCSLSWGKEVDYDGGPRLNWNSLNAQVSLSALF